MKRSDFNRLLVRALEGMGDAYCVALVDEETQDHMPQDEIEWHGAGRGASKPAGRRVADPHEEAGAIARIFSPKKIRRTVAGNPGAVQFSPAAPGASRVSGRRR